MTARWRQRTQAGMSRAEAVMLTALCCAAMVWVYANFGDQIRNCFSHSSVGGMRGAACNATSAPGQGAWSVGPPKTRRERDDLGDF